MKENGKSITLLIIFRYFLNIWILNKFLSVIYFVKWEIKK